MNKIIYIFKAITEITKKTMSFAVTCSFALSLNLCRIIWFKRIGLVMVILFCAPLRLILLWVEERNSFSTIFYKFEYETTRNICLLRIVRPVKRDWAVLSKDTPVDISILKSVKQSVFIHLWNALHMYTCTSKYIVVLSHIVRKRYFKLIWITSTLII